MPETAEEFFERVQREGLRLPPVAEWESFPFDGELQPRALQPPVDAEPPRRGEAAADCWPCQGAEEKAIWMDERWLLAPVAQPSGLPCVVLLFPRRHVDFDGLTDDEAADLGRMLVRIERAVGSVPGVGRVHVCRWGDGSYHLHYWFMARPARFPQLVGSFAAVWDDILPPTPQDVWDENLRLVVQALDGG